MKISTALLICTYNRPEVLALVFKSIVRQTQLPDEILIADDGSDEETRELIHTFSSQMSIPVIHVWQEDFGFRKAKILNKAISKCFSGYIIQIDGDCIMHKNFVEDHIKNRKINTFLYGLAIPCTANATEEILDRQLIDFGFFSGKIKHRIRNLYLPFLSGFHTSRETFSESMKGCNLSFYKQDFMDINGYNENFEGFGEEDTDLFYRLLFSGIKGKKLQNSGIMYHIFHPSVPINKKNTFLRKKTKKQKVIVCQNGVNKYMISKKPDFVT